MNKNIKIQKNILPDGAQIVEKQLTINQQSQFAKNGYLHLNNLWTRELSEIIAEEAIERWSYAKIPKRGPQTPLSTSHMSRMGTKTKSATGEILTYLHFSLLGLIRGLTGQLLVPTFSAYGYYETYDKVLLHVDQKECDVTLLTTALNEVGPIHLRPELLGKTITELGSLESNPSWDRNGGLQISYPINGVTIIKGNKIPHNRPGNYTNELSAVAALCYRSLF